MNRSVLQKFVSIFTLWSVVCGTGSSAFADETNSVTVEAESALPLGSEFIISAGSSPVYITITTSGSGDYPGSANRVATYTVTFPAAGTYELYARLRVGPGTYNDDSLFYANSFGIKSPTSQTQWVTVNGLANPSGFNNSGDVVTGGGSVGSGALKWINLSRYQDPEPPATFTVTPGNLTQTFQIGAREDGLDLDKFVFGRAGYSFTVAQLESGAAGSSPSATINPAIAYQTIEGLGGAIAFYNGWFRAHPYKEEIYSNAFAGLNLSMLRLGNWFRYQNDPNFDADAREFVAKANSYLGRPVPVMISSWAPPAFLKNNGQVGNGGSLIYTNGRFAYTEFAQYWYDSLVAYEALGVKPTWISIQNEPDFSASYDSCVFRPAESGTNYASYSLALNAVHQRLAGMPSPPKLLAPEVVHVAFNTLANYAATLNPNMFYGVAHHLYGDGGDTADSYLNSMRAATNIFPGKPRFMTEYGELRDLVGCANLIHNSLVVEQVSGYNHWSLLWPGTNGGLIQIEFPWNQAEWTNAPPGTPTQSHGWWVTPAYYAMKHYSYFIQPGFKRVAATCTDPNVLASAYLSPDGLQLVTVFINRSSGSASTLSTDFGPFSSFASRVFQSTGSVKYQALGALGASLNLPAQSVTTVVLDKYVDIGIASDPLPADKGTGVAFNSVLSWTPGSNVLAHALYLGTSSNAVAQATPASPEFRGVLTNASFHPALAGGTTYFWRVDGMAGATTNAGPVWSFSTLPVPALAHRYSFSETGGSTIADSEGGPAWNGTLPGGGSFADGQLTLQSSSQQYASLPPGIVSALTNFTIATWVRLDSTANWMRIFDFGNDTTRYMFLTPRNGQNNRLRYAITINGAGGEQQINCNASLGVGVPYQVAVTLNGSVGVLYLNGVAVGTNSALTLRPWNLGSTTNNYIGKSQWPDPYFNGRIDEFRIYTVPLSAAEIAAIYALGPGRVFNSGIPTLTVSTHSPELSLSWPLGFAGFTPQWRTNLALGNWQNVTSPTPIIVGDQWQVTLPPMQGSVFYRLAR